MRRRLARTTRLSLAAALAGLALVAPAGRAASELCPSAVQQFADGWEQIAPPAFASGGNALVDYALDPSTTDHLLATNGTEISRSTDGGCSWQQSALPGPPSAPATPAGEDANVVRQSIAQVRITPYEGESWAIGQTDVEVDNTPLTQPVVLAGSDGGRTFAAATNGLPATGQPLQLVPIPLTKRALLLFRQLGATPAQNTYSIYATTDAGTSWTQAFSALPAFNGMTIDTDGAGTSIWAWTDTALYRSVGGGAFVAVPGVSGAVRTVDVSYGLVNVFFVSGDTRLVSADNGSSWQRQSAPQNVKSATHGPLPGFLAVSGDLPNVEVVPPPSAHEPPFDASPYETNLENLQLSTAFGWFGYVLYGANSNTIFRFEVPASFVYALPAPVVVPPHPVHVRSRLPIVRTPALTPNIRTVTLAPYQHRDVPYRLLLPPTPTPLDVYFMTDSTASMADTIGSVQTSIQQIVDDLSSTGVDVHFGVADFRDYPMEDGLVATDDWAYRRDRAVGPVDDAFGQALQSIQTGGGTLDSEDSGLEAIYQAATGAGRRVLSDPSGQSDIAAGQGADFRPNAVKVIVVAADAYFRHPETNPGWPGPSRDLVAATLARLGVHLVGFDVDTGSGQDPGPDMRALALASHTVAGPAGVDCDGDGTPDLRAGDPLVCPFASGPEASIAPAFLGLLDSLRDVKPVSLAVEGPADVVRPLGATAFPRVNVKAVNRFGVPLEFRCDPPRFGRTTTVRVVAAVAGRQVASLPVAVKCGAPDPLPPPPPPAQPLVDLPALAVLRVAPPPPPQPNPNPPNPNPQVQTNPGIASQQDEVQQLAFADDGLIPADDPGLAMSALRPQSRVGSVDGSGSPPDEQGAAYLLAVGSLLGLGVACRLRTSRRWSWERSS